MTSDPFVDGGYDLTSLCGPVLRIERAGHVVQGFVHSVALGGREAPIMRAPLLEAVNEDPDLEGVMIELSRVTFINSMGLALLMDVRNLLNERGVPTVLVGVTEDVRSLMVSVRIDRMFEFAETEAEALDRIAARSRREAG